MTEKKPFAVQAAKFSLWAALLAIVMNVGARVSSLSQQSLVLIGFVSVGLYVAGLILGVAALLGMRKHGRKGILVRGILGITFKALIILCMLLAIPALARARRVARERAAQAAVEPFRFTAPPGFTEYPEGKKSSPAIIQSYIKGDPRDQQPDIVLLVEDLGGRIGKEDLSRFAQSRDDVRLLRENWKTHQIDVFELQEQFDGVSILTYNAQVPVLPKAIQLKVVGRADRQVELRDVLREALKCVEGTSNW